MYRIRLPGGPDRRACRMDRRRGTALRTGRRSGRCRVRVVAVPTGGACGPEPALASLPVDGALVWIAEHPAPGNAGDYYRFTRFVHDPSGQPMRWECGASAPSRKELWRLAGRYLEVHVALGPTSGPDRIEDVEALLNSLQVEAVSASR
jgi:hypothetical protein